MNNKDVDNLKMVKISNAIFCVRCNFAYVADVLLTDGTRKKMFYCARKDCDNWVRDPEARPVAADGDHKPCGMPILDNDEPLADSWECD